jgi:hypothetical protein
MPGRYAAETSVSPEKSQMEIKATLNRYGADSFAFAEDQRGAVVMFEAHGRKIRFDLPLPDPAAQEFRYTESGRARTDKAAIRAAYEQAVRQRWRALLLTIKAMLEAVEVGLLSFDQAFLAHIMIRDGGTVGQTLIPKLTEISDQRALMAPFQYSAYVKQIESGES